MRSISASARIDPSRVTSENQWRGFSLMAMDGSSVHLMDTEENQRLYPQPSVQKPGCGFPTLGIVGLAQPRSWRLGAHPDLPSHPA